MWEIGGGVGVGVGSCVGYGVGRLVGALVGAGVSGSSPGPQAYCCAWNHVWRGTTEPAPATSDPGPPEALPLKVKYCFVSFLSVLFCFACFCF